MQYSKYNKLLQLWDTNKKVSRTHAKIKAPIYIARA